MTKKLTLAAGLTLALFACSGTNNPNPSLDAGDTVEHDSASGDSTDDDILDTDGKPLPDSNPDGPNDPQPCDDNDPCTYGETLNDNGDCIPKNTYSCDDGHECTLDECDGQGDCIYTVKPDTCFVDGICVDKDQPHPDNPCLICLVDTTPELADVADDTPCDDLDPCTTSDTCQAGTCTPGAVMECNDDNPCTQDLCVDGECSTIALDGTQCPWNDSCVTVAVCIQGVCTPDPSLSCDDNNPCTSDTCSPTGCIHTALDGLPCDDANKCTMGDKCVADQCTPGTDTPNCEDGNLCTDNLCDPAIGCYAQLADNPCCNDDGTNICDDGNFCTYDICDPDTGACSYEYHSLQCNDQNPCTGPDICYMGDCAGPELDCSDNNPCTGDQCISPGGCTHIPLDSVPCNDGFDCSTGDFCVVGECVADFSQCVCEPDFSETVNKINVLNIGPDGHPGHGVDVDMNPETCSPKNKCSNGIDNALAEFASLVGSALQDAVDGGSVVLLLEHQGFVATGSEYTLAFYIGKEVDETCDNTSTVCQYVVTQDSFNDQCKSMVMLDNTTVNATTLKAGGPDYDFPFQFPLSETAIIDITLYSAQVSAEITYEAGQPVVVTGVLGGAINKQQMIAAVESLPDTVELPLSKAVIVQMLNALIVPDIDSNGDSVMDSASVGMTFTAHKAQISGVVAE